MRSVRTIRPLWRTVRRRLRSMVIFTCTYSILGQRAGSAEMPGDGRGGCGGTAVGVLDAESGGGGARECGMAYAGTEDGGEIGDDGRSDGAGQGAVRHEP